MSAGDLHRGDVWGMDWRDRLAWYIDTSGWRDPEACFEWQAYLGSGGYGRFHVDGATRLAHRLVYQIEVGPIPDGLVLDHFRCDNPACCRSSHVRPVTDRENILRGNGPTARCAAKQVCVNGHQFTPGSTYWTKDGARMCRRCMRAANRRHYERNREKQLERMRAYRARKQADPVAREQRNAARRARYTAAAPPSDTA